MYKTTLKIEGMMCGMCEAHVADVIRKTLPGAKKVSVTGNVPELESLLKEGKLSKYISDISTSEKKDTISFLYNGKIPALLEMLTAISPKDLTITEPSLEEIFMNYYE